ncbi:MAG TPA: alpha/beta fold hydrolase [Anaerolineae bacterium]|nr:alpha/beta fold hydrolase [Caldilineae bacterium]HID33531.1 alpha/beta fold hydrolase [Anaerolineae bacterium]
MPYRFVNRIRLYYETLGQGEPALFLHGLGSSSRGWEFQREPFAQRYQVILADVRGHGDSDKPPGPYSAPMMTEDIAALLDALGEGPVHVVGLSMGGMMGFQLAVDRPDLVRSLVVVNSLPELVPHSLGERLALWQRKLLMRALSPQRLARALGQRIFPKPEQQPLLDAFIEDFLRNDPAAYRAAANALIGWSVRDRIGAIACPVLFISGDRDYTPPEVKETYAREIPDARVVVIEDSGHATPVDQPDAFNRAVLDFLQR